nr:hypothetical protein [Desulfocapsaceae bacterium]
MENTDNIYQPPDSDLIIRKTEKDYILASKWQRFFNNIIDVAGYYIFSIIIGVLLVLLFGQKGIETIDKIPAIFQGWIVVLL